MSEVGGTTLNLSNNERTHKPYRETENGILLVPHSIYTLYTSNSMNMKKSNNKSKMMMMMMMMEEECPSFVRCCLSSSSFIILCVFMYISFYQSLFFLRGNFGIRFRLV